MQLSGIVLRCVSDVVAKPIDEPSKKWMPTPGDEINR
jgi:hypothetical protein